MSWFLVRVELHDAKDYAEAYKILHEAMEEVGFVRKIDDDEGDWYELPTAEYFISSSLEIEGVQKLGRKAAEKTGKKYWIITVKFSKARFLLGKTSTTLKRPKS
jgi:hypothetical protein